MQNRPTKMEKAHQGLGSPGAVPKGTNGSRGSAIQGDPEFKVQPFQVVVGVHPASCQCPSGYLCQGASEEGTSALSRRPSSQVRVRACVRAFLPLSAQDDLVGKAWRSGAEQTPRYNAADPPDHTFGPSTLSASTNSTSSVVLRRGVAAHPGVSPPCVSASFLLSRCLGTERQYPQ